jgi:hypothetical protein
MDALPVETCLKKPNKSNSRVARESNGWRPASCVCELQLVCRNWRTAPPPHRGHNQRQCRSVLKHCQDLVRLASWVAFAVGAEDFSLRRNVSTASEAHPNLLHKAVVRVPPDVISLQIRSCWYIIQVIHSLYNVHAKEFKYVFFLDVWILSRVWD